MYWLTRALGFIGMALLGWAGIFLVYTAGLIIVGHLPADEHLYEFRTMFFGYGAMACILGTLLGIPSFFKQGGTRLLFLLLPCVVPVLYCTGVMVYFAING